MDDFFRRESSKVVSTLTRLFGLRNFDLVEDVVQFAFLKALEAWRLSGIPRNPSAWIFRTARNRAIDLIRKMERSARIAPELNRLIEERRLPDGGALEDFDFAVDVRDSELRMIFTCCHPDLPSESSIALTLKTLCGLNAREIARALMTTEGNVTKRIYRAKQKFNDESIAFEVPAKHELRGRLELVHAVLYALFNEGYNSSDPDTLIRRDLCREALRLGALLTEEAQCRTPETNALQALMLFHTARFDARLDDEGAIVLLRDQKRELWDRGLIELGLKHLDRASTGDRLSRYHLEAGIAAKHCIANSFEETDWSGILRAYDLLIELQSSPIHELNRAVVIAQLRGPDAGIAAIESISNVESFRDSYYLVDATLGELHFRAGRHDKAREFFMSASRKTTSFAEQYLLEGKLRVCF